MVLPDWTFLTLSIIIPNRTHSFLLLKMVRKYSLPAMTLVNHFENV